MTDPLILSSPNIPKPLHGLNPRTIMGQAKWDETRREVYESTGHCCAACGVHKSNAKKHRWMEAHEIYNIDYDRGIAELSRILPLCHYCHNFIHSGRLRIMARAKKVTADDVRRIMRHGVCVLRPVNGSIFSGTKELCDLVSVDTFGLPVMRPPSRMAGWGDWRMVWDGQTYKGKFNTMRDWQRAYK